MPRAHGKRSTYIAGCRCQPCRDEEAAYRREFRRKRAQPVTYQIHHKRVMELYGQGWALNDIASHVGYTTSHTRRIIQGKFKYEPH